ncbi:MAG: hypothetical protein ACP5D2_03865 [Candidatus Nanoarchaeia archaeon]
MISKELLKGLFIGGIIGMMIMAMSSIWNLQGLAPMFYILALVLIMFISDLIERYKEQIKYEEKYEEVDVEFQTKDGKKVILKGNKLKEKPKKVNYKRRNKK